MGKTPGGSYASRISSTLDAPRFGSPTAIVFGPPVSFQGQRDTLEQLVDSFAAQCIVGFLEAVDVDEKREHRDIVPPVPLHLEGQPL